MYLILILNGSFTFFAWNPKLVLERSLNQVLNSYFIGSFKIFMWRIQSQFSCFFSWKHGLFLTEVGSPSRGPRKFWFPAFFPRVLVKNPEICAFCAFIASGASIWVIGELKLLLRWLVCPRFQKFFLGQAGEMSQQTDGARGPGHPQSARGFIKFGLHLWILMR